MADIEPTVFTKFTHYSLLIIVNEIVGLFRPPSTRRRSQLSYRCSDKDPCFWYRFFSGTSGKNPETLSERLYNILSQNTGGVCSGDAMIMNGGHNLVEDDGSGRARVSLHSILVRAVIPIVLSQWELLA
jgi:hypothetical protein